MLVVSAAQLGILPLARRVSEPHCGGEGRRHWEGGVNPFSTTDQLITMRESLVFTLELTVGREDGLTTGKTLSIELSTQ